MTEIGVRELRQHASRWLARVKAGETLVVTERGRPIARLAPLADTEHGSQLDRLIEEGRARAANGTLTEVLDRLGGPTPGAPVTPVLEELRADER